MIREKEHVKKKQLKFRFPSLQFELCVSVISALCAILRMLVLKGKFLIEGRLTLSG